MIAVVFGVLSALALGVADFLANRNAIRLGADRALCGMLAVGTAGLTATGLFMGAGAPDSVGAAALVLLHGVCLALALLLFFAALARGPISVAAPIVGAHPVLVVAFAVFAGRIPGLSEWAAMTAIVAGVVLVGYATGGKGGSATKGAARRVLPIAVSASSLYAIAVVAGQEAAVLSGDFSTLWFGRLAGLLLVTALLAARGRDLRFWRLSPGWQGLVAAHGVLDTLGFFLLLAGGTTANPEFTAVISSTFSVVTIVLACIFLRERMTPLQVSGVVLIVGGVATLGYGGA